MFHLISLIMVIWFLVALSAFFIRIRAFFIASYDHIKEKNLKKLSNKLFLWLVISMFVLLVASAYLL
ncbi:hypothetical protein A5821_002401 [Enterococcus sp. 7F3_DIV0205]|uniref:Uncharacterized protein n=1 Tax=Candidatus Enterococcus palustris TaxID=1834189 RepID=A0AAQ3WAI0_9ENTE|nr:hypothetical protein A5821_002755 [Enterococcus sp. 7F3_DIV0205]